MTKGKLRELVIFGGEKGWKAEDWKASDDSVRGGKSESHLDCSGKSARFYGNLDIKTLGGAGFASQRTASDDASWDLSKYAGIQLRLTKGDKKRYTFTLKDKLLPPNPENGREQSTISWEVDFDLPPEAEPGHAYGKSVFIPWNAFQPTYRGKPKDRAKKLDVSNIRRFSVMMRSFFGTQEGDFSLSIHSIVALSSAPDSPSLHVSDETMASQLEEGLSTSRYYVNSYMHPGYNAVYLMKVALMVVLTAFTIYQIARYMSWS